MFRGSLGGGTPCVLMVPEEPSPFPGVGAPQAVETSALSHSLPERSQALLGQTDPGWNPCLHSRAHSCPLLRASVSPAVKRRCCSVFLRAEHLKRRRQAESCRFLYSGRGNNFEKEKFVASGPYLNESCGVFALV